MYIQRVIINNIRAIKHFEMDFPNPAGWHVLIGDNGTGKSSIVRAIAATLIGPHQIAAVLPVWDEWLSEGEKSGSIELQIAPNWQVDGNSDGLPVTANIIVNTFKLIKNERGVVLESNANISNMPPTYYNWGNNYGWFSVAYGPFRRLTGGDNKWNKVFYSAPKAGAHLSVFGEDIALTEALDWLKELDRRRLKEHENGNTSSETDKIFLSLKKFINSSGLLPHQATFENVAVDGDLVFKDGNGENIKLTQMSDGYRSILSLTFELIRQLVYVYGTNATFANIEKGNIYIDLPGVVLIDEIDAHLHPTWQTRIGEWFTHYFPNLQFIVTTHSPLVCRACEKGSIWRLASPDSESESGEIKGVDKDRLIYGNILDAYGTEIFGGNVSQSIHAEEMLKELADLNVKSFKGKITDEEKQRLQQLQSILPTA